MSNTTGTTMIGTAMAPTDALSLEAYVLRYDAAVALCDDEAVLAVLADVLPDDAEGNADTTDDATLPQLADTLAQHVGYLAHWRTPAPTITGDDGPLGWSALAWSTRRDRMATAADKAAFPYLFNARGVRADINKEGRHGTQAFNAARKRLAKS